MALTEDFSYQVEVTDTDHVQVRIKRIILDDDVEISSSFHRNVISPGQDYSGYVGKVRRVCDAAHVPTAVDSYQSETNVKNMKELLKNAEEAQKFNDTIETRAAIDEAQAAYDDAKDAEKVAKKAHKDFIKSER